jgi:hypothetical protein
VAILTIGEAVGAAQRAFPDLQTSRGVQLGNLIHQEVLTAIPEARKTLVQITPTGVQEFALDYSVFQVQHVEYADDNGNVVPVLGITVEDLDHAVNKTWRGNPSVTSYVGDMPGGYGPWFYLSSAEVAAVNTRVIGFYPSPNFTTGTFNLWCSQLDATPLTASSSCLATLSNSDVYVQGIRYYAALDLYPPLVDIYKSAYVAQMALQQNYVRTHNGDDRVMSKEDLNARGQGGYSGLK